MLKQLWNDENGFVISAELILIGAILIIGLVAGLTSLRDGILTELADVGQSIGNSDQSFTVGGSRSGSAATAGFGFLDARDFGDGANSGSLVNSRCLVVSPVTGPIVGNDNATP